MRICTFYLYWFCYWRYWFWKWFCYRCCICLKVLWGNWRWSLVSQESVISLSFPLIPWNDLTSVLTFSSLIFKLEYPKCQQPVQIKNIFIFKSCFIILKIFRKKDLIKMRLLCPIYKLNWRLLIEGIRAIVFYVLQLYLDTVSKCLLEYFAQSRIFRDILDGHLCLLLSVMLQLSTFYLPTIFSISFFSQIYFCKSVIKYWPESSKLLIRCFCVTFWPPISIIYKSFYKFFCRNKMCLNFYDFLQRVLFQLHFHKSSHVSYMV